MYLHLPKVAGNSKTKYLKIILGKYKIIKSACIALEVVNQNMLLLSKYSLLYKVSSVFAKWTEVWTKFIDKLFYLLNFNIGDMLKNTFFQGDMLRILDTEVIPVNFRNYKNYYEGYRNIV